MIAIKPLKNLFYFLLALAAISCNNHESPVKPSKQDTAAMTSNSLYKEPLAGTWIHHDSAGFRIIEIIDSSHAFFSGFTDRQKDIGKDVEDKYWYYKSNATMGHWNEHSIWIETDRFRFDYSIFADTLIEFDKMGEQGKFIRVYSDDEKAIK